MPKLTPKQGTSKSGIEVEIDPEGFNVFVSFRDQKTGATAAVKLHRSAANALRALLASSETETDDTSAVILRGELTLGLPHAEPSPISA